MQLSIIKQLEQQAKSMPGAVSLSLGTPSLDSDVRIRDAARDAITNNLVDSYSHPAGILALREKITEKLIENGMRYTSDEIIVTAGSIEALSLILLTLLQPGDELLLPIPCYTSYFTVANIARVTVKPLLLAEDKEWRIDLKELEKSFTKKTKAILLTNPNNPTGSIYIKPELQAICDMAVKHHLLVILDEIYGNMYYGSEPMYSPAVEEKYKKNIIRIVSFSKDFALCGWRVAYLHTDKQYIPQLVAVHDGLVNCAPVVSQYAALTALAIDQEIISVAMKQYKKRRELMGRSLEKLSEYVDFFWPDGAYFFFPKIKNCRDSKAFCFDVLKKEKLAIVPGSAFGENGEGHVRLCFGRSEYEITEGMKRLEQYFKNYA